MGSQCHELRINDAGSTWRIMYYLEADAVVILDVFSKKTETTPQARLMTCRKRLAAYRQITRKKKE